MSEGAAGSRAPGSRPGARRLLSDARLARRAAEGDPRAFETIYSRYHQDLYRFCLAMVGNPQDAQDALQSTMFKALRALPGEQRQIQLKPWLYRIARNESVETLRKRRDNAELEASQVAVVGVTETAETRERLRTLLADLEQLPERQRAALVMRELAGLEFEQIAATFGTSPAVARQTLYEARLSLRQLEAGREMRCADVMRELSDADGRVTRRREIRAHLSSCADCRAFRDDIAKRRGELAALAPLPLTASAGLLHSVLGGEAAGGGGAASSGFAGTVGAGAGKAVATSAVVKSAATVAVATVVGMSAADRGGLIDLPLPGKDTPAAESSAGSSQGSASGSGSGAEARQGTQNVAAGGRSAAGGLDRHQTGKNGRDGNGGRAHAGNRSHAASTPSRSHAGQAPPGGGYGRSAADRREWPEKASKGQQTAASHKPESAVAPPAQNGANAGRGKASAPSTVPKSQSPEAAPPATQPQASPPTIDDPSPSSEAATQPSGGSRAPER